MHPIDSLVIIASLSKGFRPAVKLKGKDKSRQVINKTI